MHVNGISKFSSYSGLLQKEMALRLKDCGVNQVLIDVDRS